MGAQAASSSHSVRAPAPASKSPVESVTATAVRPARRREASTSLVSAPSASEVRSRRRSEAGAELAASIVWQRRALELGGQSLRLALEPELERGIPMK